jgi:hypothetical protein
MLLLSLISAGVTACSSGAPPTHVESGTQPSRTADPSPTGGTVAPSASPTPVPNPAPTELVGVWTTTVIGEAVTLVIEPGTYRILRGGQSGSGLIDVVDGEITFHSSTLCSGSGTYSWAVDRGRLTFSASTTDPCPGRATVLVDVIYEQ